MRYLSNTFTNYETWLTKVGYAINEVMLRLTFEAWSCLVGGIRHVEQRQGVEEEKKGVVELC